MYIAIRGYIDCLLALFDPYWMPRFLLLQSPGVRYLSRPASSAKCAQLHIFKANTSGLWTSPIM